MHCGDCKWYECELCMISPPQVFVFKDEDGLEITSARPRVDKTDRCKRFEDKNERVKSCRELADGK